MKQKLLTATALMLVLILSIGCVAFAGNPPADSGSQADPPATETPTPTPSPTPDPEPDPEPAVTDVLRIENERIYEGMDRPYKNGYVPVTANGAVTIVLPLVTSQTILKSRIDVKFDLGDSSSSPFQFGNYDKTFHLKKHKTDKDEKEAYLVSVVLPLSGSRQMGNYPVTMQAKGLLADGTEFSQEFTVYVVIRDGIDPNAPEPDPDPIDTSGGGGGGEPEAQPEPKVMITTYTVSPDPVVAGEAFTIAATIKNTDEKQTLKNVKVTVKGESNDLLPKSGTTGTFFFESIEPEQTINIAAEMTAAQNSAAEPHKLVFSLIFDGANAQKFEATEEIVVQLTQPIRLDYDEPEIPEEMNAGDTIQVSLNVMNLGLGTVHNVRLSMDAPALIPDKTVFMGNIESGASQQGDMYVFVGTLDMQEDGGYSSEDKYGPVSGVVKLTYEDEFGKETVDEFKFDSYINPPAMVFDPEDEEKEEEEPKNTGQWWISIIVAAAIIIAIILLRKYIVKKQRMQREQDEAN